ncbi:MAG: sulfatase [Pirellulales bacterium]
MRRVLRFVCAALVGASVLGFVPLALAAGSEPAPAPQSSARPPNVVIIFADDLGYGDLGCYGHPTIATPRLDQMAAAGLRFTQFYVAECVCTPSRAALLTGRLPIRNGMCSDVRRVLFANSKGGLPHEEVTIAEVLKTRGYHTACVGKWHLGHLPQFLPKQQGFDSYFGIPYSNDMRPTVLLRGEQIVEDPADQTTLTRRYTDEAVTFMREHKDGPFFLYLAHNFPHVPLFASPEFRGRSPRGLYGDVVSELDASVGRVLDTLVELAIDRETLVFFTSDNGPWLIKGDQGGSAGLLREGKGSTWEGGMREPAIAWWPGTIAGGGTTGELASSLDFLATIAALAGAQLPTDRTLDSLDLGPLLLGRGPSPRHEMFYYRGRQLMAVRSGPWKAHFMTQAGYGQKEPERHDPPLLFHLEHDPSEQRNVAAKHPDVVSQLQQLAGQHAAGVMAPPSQLELQ